MTDETPDLLAAMDQLLRAVVDVARAVRAYHVALVAEDQALCFGLAYQARLLQGSEDGS